MAADTSEFTSRIVNRGTGSQSADCGPPARPGLEPLSAFGIETPVGGRRRPELGLAIWKVESLRHHAGHCQCPWSSLGPIVYHQCLADDVGRAREPPLPEAMADHRDGYARGFVSWRDWSALFRGNAQKVEQVSRNEAAPGTP